VSCYVWKSLKKAIQRESPDLSAFVRQALVRELKRRGVEVRDKWRE
jgi:hypothetical protein